MVNNPQPRILVRGACSTRTGTGNRIKICNGPVYNLVLAKQLLNLHGPVVVNENANDGMAHDFEPSLTIAELKSMVLALDAERHYIESERCRTTSGMEIDADAYAIYWHRAKCTESARVGTKTFVKFGFRENNPKCLIVSIHRSKY